MKEGCRRISKFENKQIRRRCVETQRLASLLRILYRAFYDDKSNFWEIMLRLKEYVDKHYKEYS